MKKIVSHKTIHFYDDENNEIMYIDHSTDECIWYFHSDNIINVTADMELYNLLYIFMNNYYTEVPTNIVTGKDLDYLSDMFQWNYGALKNVINSIENVESEKMILVMRFYKIIKIVTN